MFLFFAKRKGTEGPREVKLHVLRFARSQTDPDQMRRRIPPRPRPREGKSGAGPPQIDPVDMNLVKGILREYDRGAYGEEFRGDRLAKIGFLGKGEFLLRAVERDKELGHLLLSLHLCLSHALAAPPVPSAMIQCCLGGCGGCLTCCGAVSVPCGSVRSCRWCSKVFCCGRPPALLCDLLVPSFFFASGFAKRLLNM